MAACHLDTNKITSLNLLINNLNKLPYISLNVHPILTFSICHSTESWWRVNEAEESVHSKKVLALL